MKVRPTARFIGDRHQVVEVELDLASPELRRVERVRLGLEGCSLTAEPVVVVLDRRRRRFARAEICVIASAPPGTSVDIAITVEPLDEPSIELRGTGSHGTLTATATFVVAAPGTVVHLVPHFHMDPVWWNTQAASVSDLDRSDWSASPRLGFQRSAFAVLEAHLDRADSDADYRVCVAEVDYLRPFLERHPARRRRLARLIAAGRVEVVGATHNEPNTNLTSVELTRRNLVHGLAFQRGVLGAQVSTAWQLDVFGHHPSFPSLLEEVGVAAVSLSRGPYRAWGPMLSGGFDTPHRPDEMQMRSESDWVAPDGGSAVLTYLASHYSSGWAIDAAPGIDAAAEFVVELGDMLRSAAATRHVMLLVGTDLSPPSRHVVELGEHVAGRSTWPEVRCSSPSEFLREVRAELAAGDRVLAPQTRDLNPVYTGKDVSYIDTKQAHRRGEQLAVQAEIWATLAAVRQARCVDPTAVAAIDHAWRLLVYGAHHDALTGTESDQVYVDLLAGWRRAHDLAAGVAVTEMERLAIDVVGGRAGQLVVTVFSSLAGMHRDVVEVELGAEALVPLATTGLSVVDHAGRAVPHVVERAERAADGTLVSATLAVGPIDVEGIGHRTLSVRAGDTVSEWVCDESPGATSTGPATIANATFTVTVDPRRGGCVTSWIDRRDGIELLAPGRLGNEVVWWPEYPAHPVLGEGPWHISPCGPSIGSSAAPAVVRREHSAVGERVTVAGSVAGIAFTSRLTLWTGIERLDGVVDLDDVDGHDHIVRLRWPCAVPGATPLVGCDGPVLGRGFAHVDVDAAVSPWTFDTPAYGWFGVGVTAGIDVVDDDGRPLGTRAIGIAEVVVADADRVTEAERALVLALARVGVTATVTDAAGPRYGASSLDSNLPDVRLSVGVQGRNGFTSAVLASSSDAATLASDQLVRRGAARLVVPAAAPLREVWTPGADLRAIDALPVVMVIGRDPSALAAELAAIADALAADARFTAMTVSATSGATLHCGEQAVDRTVAWINTGTPGSAVDVDGAMHMSLMRGSTGWPAGQWIDPPRRTAPDGSSFQSQHWSHRFEHSLVAGTGDWRTVGVQRAAAARQRPFTAVVATTSAATSSLPSPACLLSVAPSSVEITACKPADDGSDHVVVRCTEMLGRDTVAVVDVGVARLGGSTVRAAELVAFDEAGTGTPLEVHEGSRVTVPIGGWRAVTVRLTLDRPADEAHGATGSRSDVSRHATFSRYWVQNRGPAPLGDLPLAVHLHPSSDSSGAGRWRATVALSDRHHTIEGGAVTVDLAVEMPWPVTTGATSVEVVPGGHAHVDVFVDDHDADALDAGFHVARVVGTVVGEPDLAAFDEHVLARSTRGRHVTIEASPESVSLAPGERGHLRLRLGNHADRAVWGEVEVVSPWGSWDLLPMSSVPVELAPGAVDDVEIPVVVPAGHRPGRWWVLGRVLCGAVVSYSEAAWLEVVAADQPS